MQDSPASSAPLETSDIHRLVGPPAISMIVVAGLSLLYRAVEFLFEPFGKLLRWASTEAGADAGDAVRLYEPLGLGKNVLGLVVSTVVLVGAVKMLQQRSWALSMAAAILISIPCIGPCCPFGIPIGIWSLMVLFRPDVRAALERHA